MYNIEQFLGCLVAELHDRLHGLVATVYILGLELDIDELLIIIISTNMVRRKKLKMELI